MDKKELKNQLSLLKDSSLLEISDRLNELYKLAVKNNTGDFVLEGIKPFLLRNLKKQFKEGSPVRGSLEKKFIEEDRKLKELKGKWARKRGFHFEKIILQCFKKYFLLQNSTAFIYKNYISKFEYQPYDLCIFLSKEAPLLLECKASGIKSVKDNLKIAADPRRYVRAYKNKELVERTILKAQIPYYYVYGDLPQSKFYIVSAKLITENLPFLFTRGVPLKEECYLHLDLDSSTWDTTVLEKIKNLKTGE